MTQPHDMVVVGAGPHGLCVTWAARRRGLRVLTLDSGAVCGGAWPRMWPELRCLSRRADDTDPDGEPPLAAGPFATAGAVATQWQRFAERHSLPVQLGKRVVRLEAVSGQFNLHTGDDVVLARQVVVASGEMGAPQWNGLGDTLPERVIHVAQLTVAALGHCRRVVVVGAGNSAAQVATLALQLGVDVALCARTPPWTGWVWPPLPRLLRRRLARAPWLLSVLGRRCARRVPLQGRDLHDAMVAGRLTVHPQATAVQPGGVTLSDGQVLRGDLVVLCTGFRRELGWMAELAACDASGWPLHHRGLSRQVPGLAFAGLLCTRTLDSGFLRGAVADAVALVDALMGVRP